MAATITPAALVRFVEGEEPFVGAWAPAPAPSVVAEEVEEAWVEWGNSQGGATARLRGCTTPDCHCGNGPWWDDYEGTVWA